jgi:hypothetical protein
LNDPLPRGQHLEVRNTNLLDLILKTESSCHGRRWNVKRKTQWEKPQILSIGQNLQPVKYE